MRKFGARSLEELMGVHQHLVVLATHALLICDVDFAVHDGLRTTEEQDALVKAGASRTRNSRHLTGHAVDLVPYVGSGLTWNDEAAFHLIANAMREASQVHGIPVEWGAARVHGGDFGNWNDMAHWQLPRSHYPGL